MNNQSNKQINSKQNGRNKDNYPPQWVEDMQKWQNENPDERAVLCIAVGNKKTTAALFGSNLSLMFALLGAMNKDLSFAEVCKGALAAKENPVAALALISALENSTKGETPAKEDDDNPDDTSLKDSLKTILSKLADKL